MVPMRVQIADLAVAVFAVAQSNPGGDPRQRAVPTLAAGDVRRFTEPEGARGRGLEARRLEQHGGKFAAPLTVVAADPDERIVAKMLAKIIDLDGQHLLRADEIGPKAADRVEQDLLPLFPGVFAVGRRGVA